VVHVILVSSHDPFTFFSTSPFSVSPNTVRSGPNTPLLESPTVREQWRCLLVPPRGRSLDTPRVPPVCLVDFLRQVWGVFPPKKNFRSFALCALTIFYSPYSGVFFIFQPTLRAVTHPPLANFSPQVTWPSIYPFLPNNPPPPDPHPDKKNCCFSPVVFPHPQSSFFPPLG